MKGVVFAALLVATSAFGQPRGGTDEWGINVVVIGTQRYAFDGGATARNDGGAGLMLQAARNFNDYFSLGVESTLATFNYRARVTPGTGNAAAAFDAEGDMESLALRVNATWNLLSVPLTPFVTGAAGVIFLDPNLVSDPPAGGCWSYPWYGEACSDKAPRTTLARFSYGAAAGLRYDLPRKQGFMRAAVGGEWIAIPEATSTVGYLVLRADFGIAF
jgi:hypothetical protein